METELTDSLPGVTEASTGPAILALPGLPAETDRFGSDPYIQEYAPDPHELARKAQAEILEAMLQCHRDWVALIRKIENFRDSRLFQHVIDPETGKPFTRIDEWGHRMLRISPAKLFADLRVVHQLNGVVSDERLARMPKGNAVELARRKQANQPIDGTLVEDAIKLSLSQLRTRHPAPTTRASTRPQECTARLGPYRVTEETARLFQKAFSLATRSLASSGEPSHSDRAIAIIARQYLDANTIEADPEVAASDRVQ